MFGTRQALRTKLPEDSVLIVAADDKWNDFRYRTQIDVIIHFRGETHSTLGFLGFLKNDPDSPNGIDYLAKLLGNADALTIPANESHRFFTMRPNMEEYRKFVKKFGPSNAQEILFSINDVVATSEFKPSVNWINLAVEEKVFLKSFIRSAESYFAFKHAAPI